MSNETPPAERFVNAIGELGAAWGLPRDACRLHALLYLNQAGIARAGMANALNLSEAETAVALSFLTEYNLAWTVEDDLYKAHDDPWTALSVGLRERRARDLPAMRATLLGCRADISVEGTSAAAEAAQIDKMISLVDDLSAIHTRAFSLPPRLLRGVINLSGRAARWFGSRID